MTMVDQSFFSQRVESFRIKVARLLKQLRNPKVDSAQYMEESFLELTSALEELQVADEELQQQLDELDISRELADTERRRYEELFEFAPDGYIVTSPDGAIQEANRAACRLLRKPARYLIGKPLIVWVREEERRNFRQHINQAVQQRAKRNFQARVFFAKQSDDAIFSLTLEPAFTEAGKLQSIRWMIQDVTEQRNAEKLMEEHQQRFQTIFNHSPVGMQLLDKRGFILEANQAFQQMLGYGEKELKKLSFADLFYLDDLEKVAGSFQQLANGQNDHFGCEVRMICKDHSTCWVRLRVARYSSEADRAGFAIGSVEDITVQKEALCRLEQSRDQAFQRFQLERRSLAHQLNTGALEDLFLIQNKLESIANTLQNHEAGAEIEAVDGAMQHVVSSLNALVEELMARSDTSFDLETAVVSFLEQVKWEYPGISYTIEMTKELQRLPEHTRLVLFQIFHRMVLERVKYAHPDRLAVQLRLLQDMVELEIQDNGAGLEVPNGVPNGISNLLRNGHDGLASAMEHAEAIHGNLSVETELVDRGTTIRVVAPLPA